MRVWDVAYKIMLVKDKTGFENRFSFFTHAAGRRRLSLSSFEEKEIFIFFDGLEQQNESK